LLDRGENVARIVDKRSVFVVGLLVAGISAGALDARAEEARATAVMQCERAAEPGRVRCSVEVRTTAPRSIGWADVALVELPDFAAALKGRIGPGDTTARDPTSQKWAFGLVARKAGQGEARARVRVVVCEAAGPPADAGRAPEARCLPMTIDVRASLHVG
jgi:hypothetical protein